MTWELTRREFLKRSVYFPNAVKAWLKGQLEQGEEADDYQLFLPFVASGARELSMFKVEWRRSDWSTFGVVTLHDNNQYVQPKIGNCDVRIVRLKGHGMPPVNQVNEPKGNDQVGITWLKDNLEPRHMELTIQLDGTYEDLWIARRYLVSAFTPRNSFGFGGFFTFYVPGGRKRRLYARYESGLDFDDEPGNVDQFILPVMVWSQDPRFYDEDETIVTGTGASPLSVACSNPGDLDVYPFIVVRASGGTLVDPLVENTTTNEDIQLNSITIPNGGEFFIQCTYGDKDVWQVGVGSILNNVDPDNDLGSFHLQPGNNTIRITVGGASTGVPDVSVDWRTPWLSL